jgi:hypothetical protein
MQRDKSEQIKELQALEEMCISQNEDTSIKLGEEKEKYDKLKEDRIRLEHTLSHNRATLKVDEAFNKDTGDLIKKIADEIAKIEEGLKKKIEEDEVEKKVNNEENKKNRHFLQRKSALTAKSTFIEENYDYCTNVKEMEGGIFR